MQPNVLVSRLIETWARAPEACVLAVDDEQVSARAIEAAVQKLAARLTLDSGISSGAVVGLCVPRSIEWVVAQLAVLRLGGVVVQMDAAASADRLRSMVALLSPAVVLTDSAALPKFAGLVVPCTALPSWRSLQDLPDGPLLPPVLEVPDAQPAYIMFTSGTTGTPKAVPVPGAGLVRLAGAGTAIDLRGGQRWAALASPGFDAALLELWCPLLNGGVCVLQTLLQPDLQQLAQFFVEQRISDVLLTTSLFNAMIEDQIDAFQGVRQVLMGGEQASPAHARSLLAAFPDIRLVNAYGPTENAVVSLCHRVTAADLEDPDGIPIGQPLPGDEVCLDGDCSLGAIPPGSVGELWVSGPGVGQDYLGASKASEPRFIWRAGRQWYRTGDRVRLGADKVFRYLGRMDRQVKIRGHRIELDEVELHLSRALGVSEALVHVEGDSAETRHLVAVVAGFGSPAELPVEQLRAHLLRDLPAAAVPARWVPVLRLPRNLSGKADRAAARQLAVAGPRGRSFLSALSCSFAQHGGRAALVDGQHRFTYHDIDVASARWASAFSLAGVRQGDVVPLHGPRSADMVLAMVALLRLGAAFAPIDLQSPPERVLTVLDALRPPLMLADSSKQPHFAAWMTRCPVHAFEDWRAQLPDVGLAEWVSPEPERPVYVMFTSGSTGVPKGVMVTDANLGALLVDPAWADFSLDARWLWATSPAFDIAMVEIWGALLHGAELVILQGHLPALSDMVGLIKSHSITHVQLSTALFNALVDVDVGGIQAVRQFITGGERASPSHMRRALLACPDLVLINGYGPTEATVYATARLVSLADTWDPEGVPIGAPLPGVHVKVAPESGELWLGGAGVALGYHGAPELTQDRFVSSEGERWYRTGDLVRVRADGVLTYHGRADRQVKLQGQRFELDEVELAIASSSQVLEAIVFVRGTDASRQLVACVRAAAGQTLDEAGLARAVARRLPEVAVPKRWWFFDQFPVTTNGKVDRQALAQWIESAPPQDAVESANKAEATWGTTTEEALAEIWRELLPHSFIHRQTHFIKAGGTSILALRVAAQVEARLGKRLRPVDVLLHPVLSDQARWIEQLPDMIASDGSALGAHDANVWQLTEAQLALLSAASLDETGSAYLVHVALCWPAASDMDAFRQAMLWLAQRHPVLRIRIDSLAGVWRARVAPELGRAWWCSRSDRLSRAPLALEAWDPHVLEAIQRPLDLAQEGVLRADVWPREDGGWVSVLTLHHAVVDEESVEQLLNDLSAYLAGHPTPVQPVESSRLVALERGLRTDFSGDFLSDTLERLRGCRPPLGRVPAAGHEQVLSLPAQWASTEGGGLAKAQQLGRSPFGVFLACHVRAIQAVFGAGCRHVSTPFSRRAMAELQGVITYWVDVPVLDLGQRADETVSEHLARVESALIQQQALRFSPVHDLSAALSPHDPGAALMLTQFGMTWREAPERTIQMGPWQIDLVRVPQRAARFGLCLHLARSQGRLQATVEGVDEVFSHGWFEAYARAFHRCLSDVQSVLDSALLPDVPHALVVPDGLSEEVLRGLWVRWLGCSPDQVAAGSNFFVLGGTSLKAMRMAADLQAVSGFSSDMAAFLSDPTFSGWAASIRAGGQTTVASIRPAPSHAPANVVVGAAEADHVLFLIPGLGGHALGLVGIAQSLVSQDPGCRVVIPDLDGMLGAAPEDRLLPALLDQLLLCARNCGVPRESMALAGFSLGGLLALMLAGQWGTGGHQARPPVFLIDTYAGRMASQSKWRLLERKVARIARYFSWWEKAPVAPMTLVAPEVQMPVQTTRHTWAALETALASSTALHEPLAVDVTLVKARFSEAAAEIWWRRGSNGLNPALFSSFKVLPIDAWHLDLARDKSAETARRILATWRSSSGH